MTSLKNCNIPNVTTNTTYLAVLPPVLNIFPVSCTLEAQQMEIAIGEKCFKLKPGTEFLNLDPGDHFHGKVDE